jgi:glycerol-3-phosphate dehydrogenase
LSQCIPGLDDTIKAELAYVIKHEMVYTLSDLMLRRTDIASFERPPAETIKYCADLMEALLGWNASQRAENIDALIKKFPAWSEP